MTSTLFELLVNLFDSWLGVYFVLKLNRGKPTDRPIFTMVSILLCFAVSTAYLYISAFSFMHSVIILAILLVFSFALRTGTLLTRILAPVVFELILIINSSLWSIVFSHLFSVSLAELFSQSSTARYLYVLCTKIVLSAVIFLTLRLLSAKHDFHTIDLVIYLASPAMSVFVLYTFIRISLRFDTSEFSAHIVMSILGLAALNLLSLFLFIRASQNAQARTELEIIKRQTELEHKNYTELGKLYQQLRTLRHDFRQHLIVLKQLMANNEPGEVDKYISDRETQLNNTAAIIHTNNRMMDYIINAKISANPDVTFLITGECAKLSEIDEFDLASLMGNLLDNAIEATEAHGEKLLELEFFIKNNYQNIICKNPITESILQNNPHFRSTKGRKGHGYGIKSMKKIVDEANGFIDFFEEESHFYVQIALPISAPLSANSSK